MARTQPLHDLCFQRIDDQQVHAGRSLSGHTGCRDRPALPHRRARKDSTNMPPPVRKAVFPVAGLGTRSLPATKAIPKEMLPVVDKPLIQYAVEEAYAAGVREMIFVTGRHKRAIEDHFDLTAELEQALEQGGKRELLDAVRAVKPNDMSVVAVRQPQALGLGHAVLCARSVVGNEPFAVLLPDDLMIGTPPILAQMVAQYEATGGSMVAVQEVPAEQTKRYGIVAGTPTSDRLVEITKIVE